MLQLEWRLREINFVKSRQVEDKTRASVRWSLAFDDHSDDDANLAPAKVVFGRQKRS